MEGWMNSARGHSRYSGFQWPRKMRVKNTYLKFTETFQTTLQHNPDFHSTCFVFSACSDYVVKITAFHPEEVWCDEKATHRKIVFSGVERIQDDYSYPPPWRVYFLSYSGSYRLIFWVPLLWPRGVVVVGGGHLLTMNDLNLRMAGEHCCIVFPFSPSTHFLSNLHC